MLRDWMNAIGANRTVTNTTSFLSFANLTSSMRSLCQPDSFWKLSKLNLFYVPKCDSYIVVCIYIYVWRQLINNFHRLCVLKVELSVYIIGRVIDLSFRIFRVVYVFYCVFFSFLGLGQKFEEFNVHNSTLIIF